MTRSERGGVTSQDRLPRDRPSTSRGGISDQAQKRLGRHLQAMYDTVVQQPIPDHLADLIARLQDDDEPAVKL